MEPPGVGMTIREKLARLRGRLLLLALVGLLLLLVGLLGRAGDSEKLAFMVAGSVVIFVAVFQFVFGLRCPRCDAWVAWAPGRSERKRCGRCGIDLDSPMGE